MDAVFFLIDCITVVPSDMFFAIKKKFLILCISYTLRSLYLALIYYNHYIILFPSWYRERNNIEWREGYTSS